MSAEGDKQQQPNSGEQQEMSEETKYFTEIMMKYKEGLEAGNQETADNAAIEAFMHASMSAAANPSPDLIEEQITQEFESKGDWTSAEASRKKLLAMREAGSNALMVSKSYQDLSGHYGLLNRLDEAWEAACKGSSIARGQGIEAFLATAIRNQGAVALRKGDVAGCLTLVDEMLAELPTDVHSELPRARLLILRAEALLLKNDLAGVQAELKNAWQFLGNKSTNSFFAGIVGTVAHWWEIQAQMLARQGDSAGARKSISNALENGRHVAQLCHVAGPYTQNRLARLLMTYADILLSFGDTAGAEAASEEAKAIRTSLRIPATVT